MDRLSQLKGTAGGSGDSTLDTSTSPSEAYVTANDNSKYFSVSDSTFDTIKDDSITSTPVTPDSDQLISNLSPIPKKSDLLDGYNIGKQIEAANILSGGVNIFDDNDNSCDGDGLVIDDNAVVEMEGKTSLDMKVEDSSALMYQKSEESLVDAEAEGAIQKDPEVALQIDGKNIDAINIGNGLYLYRKEGQEELSAIQITDDDQQQPSFKFLKVRENADGNLEVYEEIEIEVPKETSKIEPQQYVEITAQIPTKDINKIVNDNMNVKAGEKQPSTLAKDNPIQVTKQEIEVGKDYETISELNLNGKTMKFSESRKSPIIGSFTPMTYHSTPNKEGIPLTKTMVDQQLHPSRHSDNAKKTIEVHTDGNKQKIAETSKENICALEVSKTLDFNLDTKPKENEHQSRSLKESKDENQIMKNTELTPNKMSNETRSRDVTETNDISNEIPAKEKDVNNETSDNNDVTNINDDKLNDLNEKKVDNDLEVVEDVKSCEDLKMVDSDRLCPDDTAIIKETTSEKESTENADTLVKDQSGADDNATLRNDQSTNNVTISHVASDKISSSTVTIVNDNNNENHEVNKTCEIIAEENVLAIPESKGLKKPEPETAVSEPVPSESIAINNCSTSKSSKLVANDKIDVKETTVIENKVQALNENVLVNDEIKKTSVDIDKKHLPLITNKIDSLQSEKKTMPKLPEVKNENNGSTKTCEASISLPTEVQNIKAIDVQNDEKKPKVDQKPAQIVNVNVTETKLSEPPVVNVETATSVKTQKDSQIINEKTEDTTQVINQNDKSNTSTPVNQNHKPSVAVEKHLSDITDPKKIGILNINVLPEIKPNVEIKPTSMNNNHSAVPFGKWTAANRLEFLNKCKESKIPTNSATANQIKQTKDLNRRDILKKMDSHRQTTSTSKAADVNFVKASNVKNELTTCVNQLSSTQSKPVKNEQQAVKLQLVKPISKHEIELQSQSELVKSKSITESIKEERQRKEINNQDLIDRTIEDMIIKPALTKSVLEEKAAPSKDIKHNKALTTTKTLNKQHCQKKNESSKSLDDIEMKMNELHGIPFVERPANELPKVKKSDVRSKIQNDESIDTDKTSKMPNLLPLANKTVVLKDKVVELDSEDEIIEHEPITGDIDLRKKNNPHQSISKKSTVIPKNQVPDLSKKEAIITEKDFDKFARRNSVTCENQITVNFGDKMQHNVVQTVVEKDNALPKKSYKNEIQVGNYKPISYSHQNTSRPVHKNVYSAKLPTSQKLFPDNGNIQKEIGNPTKVQMAYQSLTSNRHKDTPIALIEDEPVKVIFMDSNTEYLPCKLNVQGQALSPAKTVIAYRDSIPVGTCDSTDADIDSIDTKQHDDCKVKVKHQRKQVLTPVATPDLELIEPSDLGLEVSPRKKRKTEEKPRNLAPKKSYLLNHNIKSENKQTPTVNDNLYDKTTKPNDSMVCKNTASAIDSLVKAAELLENQSKNLDVTSTNVSVSTIQSDSPQNTPVKRGRGRPRKYPISEEGREKTKTPSPQKKPRLIDAMKAKSETSSDDEDFSSDEEIIRENWTMGKINENIVCPICNKLFRSENVVFKHVKHCTGPSPSRSDSDKSTRRSRQSQGSETKSRSSQSDDLDMEICKEINRRKRKSRESLSSRVTRNYDVIVIEDTPKKAPENKGPNKNESKRLSKSKVPIRVDNLECEFCGKKFRQLSYLVSHKLQHKKETVSKVETQTQSSSNSVFNCEVCSKEFRKLHHLVQHRMIHNPPSAISKSVRKSVEQTDTKVEKRRERKSSDQTETKIEKRREPSKQVTDDQSAGFRCEPCDKSFRKLHHLVEHRETHDGINRQKSTSIPQPIEEKSTLPPQCEICNKTFRKLHHLIEHKEQHVETSSEKSDDKSIKSALSTKDIIHECSLCYMVFPNEHSLTKHTVICQKKKKQALAKQAKQANENVAQHDEILQTEDNETRILDESTQEESKTLVTCEMEVSKTELSSQEMSATEPNTVDSPKETKVETEVSLVVAIKDDSKEIEIINLNDSETTLESVDKSKKVLDVQKRKTPVKEKIVTTVTKRKKSVNVPLPIIEDRVPVVESSDDDEVRYMLNPYFKKETGSEGKAFMNVRANKRNSLQIERLNSKDLAKRRTSLQHPPKIPRLKSKSVEKTVPVIKNINKPKLETVPCTDSDDSDVKYSFPKIVTEKEEKSGRHDEPKETEKKKARKTLVDKRKSLGGIAKRKLVAKLATPKPKAKEPVVKETKRRTTMVEHRCDCGQLFGSAALLARHTTLAHTPPRIRRERALPSPSGKSQKKVEKLTTVTKTDSKQTETGKSTKINIKSDTTVIKVSSSKPKRNTAHRGVPVPEQMRKLMEKTRRNL